MPFPFHRQDAAAAPARPRIVVLGAGFAGTACARGLVRRLGRDGADVLIVDRNNYMLFTPLLVEAGVGRLEPRYITLPVRQLVPEARFLQAEVLGLDLDARRIHVRAVGHEKDDVLEYDQLAVTVGSTARMPADLNLRMHLHPVHGIADAIALRERVMYLLEAAAATTDHDEQRRLLHLVVVGGNYTGVEVAGEYQALLRRASAAYRTIAPTDCRVTLVDRGERLLAGLPHSISVYAAAQLRRAGVTVRIGAGLTSGSADDGRLTDGRRLHAATFVWCAGVTPNPLIARTALPVDGQGWVRAGADLSIEGHADVWAFGDCAVNPAPDGRPYPPTGQHAQRLGAHAARNIAARLRGEPTTPAVIRQLGTLVPLGPRRAVARVAGITLRGAPALALARAAYLGMIPGLGRKSRIALAWLTDLFAGPAVVRIPLPTGEALRPPATSARGRSTDDAA